MPPLPPNIVFTKARPSDIPAIHELGRLGFLSDSHTQMKNHIKGDEDSSDGGFATHLQSLLDNPRIDIVVARDTSSDSKEDVVGIATWARVNYDKAASETTSAPPSWGPVPAQPPLPPHRPLTVSDLEDITDQSMATWQAYFSPPGVRCRVVVGLSVNPAYQGKGIGKALMSWGTDKCDEDGVYCWVQSSMGAKGAYESAGFREVGRLELDLDLFAGGALPDGGGRWGVYVWPYMRREAVLKR